MTDTSHFGEQPDIDGDQLPPEGHDAAEVAVGPATGTVGHEDLRISWKNLALLGLGQLSPAEHPDLFAQLHRLVDQDNKRSALWIVKPASGGQFMYLAKNIQNGNTLVTSEIEHNRGDAVDMAHFFADAAGQLVVDQHGIEL